MAKKDLEDMVSAECIKSIKNKIRNFVGKKAMLRLYPAVKKIIEEGDGEIRESILHDWLDIDSVRICSNCGEIMQEGWYLDMSGYACSDECAMKIMGVPDMEHFRRYRIYKEDIDEWLDDEGLGRKEEDLTQDEIEEIINEINNNIDACYTEWY